MNDNILITGKRGFIGRWVAGGRPFLGCIQNIADLMRETADITGIVHLAAKSNNKVCEANPKRSIETNLVGLCNVLETALHKDIWVLFISTYQVKEKNLYGISKLMGEELCKVYKDLGVRVNILRLPIVYGPKDKPSKVVTKIINEIKEGKEPVINTDDSLYFAYVEDVAHMIESEVAVLEGYPEKFYNLRDLVDGIRECLNE